MRTGFNYKKATGEITSTVSVSKASDLALNKETGCKLFVVSNTHRALGKVHEYEIKVGKIKRREQYKNPDKK